MQPRDSLVERAKRIHDKGKEAFQFLTNDEKPLEKTSLGSRSDSNPAESQTHNQQSEIRKITSLKEYLSSKGITPARLWTTLNGYQFSIPYSETSPVSEGAESLEDVGFPRYLVGNKYLGSGSENQVYLALDMHLGIFVAVKGLKEWRYSPRLQREGKLTAAATQPNPNRSISIYEHVTFLTPEGRKANALILEHLSDESSQIMRDFINEISEGKKVLSPEEYVFILRRLKEQLIYLRNIAGIRHNDIKPENLSINENFDIKAFDYNVAELIDEAEDQSGNIGTGVYMSSHRINGERTFFRSDVEILGLLAYELLVGRQPFQKNEQMGRTAYLKYIPQRFKSAILNLEEKLSQQTQESRENSQRTAYQAVDMESFLTAFDKTITIIAFRNYTAEDFLKDVEKAFQVPILPEINPETLVIGAEKKRNRLPQIIQNLLLKLRN